MDDPGAPVRPAEGVHAERRVIGVENVSVSAAAWKQGLYVRTSYACKPQEHLAYAFLGLYVYAAVSAGSRHTNNQQRSCLLAPHAAVRCTCHCCACVSCRCSLT
jgi:hypothetical protein